MHQLASSAASASASASEEIERSRKRNQKDGLNQNDITGGITEGRSEIQKHIEIYLPSCFYETTSFSRRLAKRRTNSLKVL